MKRKPGSVLNGQMSAKLKSIIDFLQRPFAPHLFCPSVWEAFNFLNKPEEQEQKRPESHKTMKKTGVKIFDSHRYIEGKGIYYLLKWGWWCTAVSIEYAIDSGRRSLENFNSHSHLQSGLLMGFHCVLKGVLRELLRDSADDCLECMWLHICASFAVFCVYIL